MKRGIAILMMVVASSLAFGQTITVPQALVQFPELVLVNGKIVTVDNEDISEDVGRIVSAMAVRDGRILALGNDAQIRPLAGPQTRIIDLKGRTVLPGLIDSHDHPHEWMWANQTAMKEAFRDSELVIRFVDGPGEQKMKIFDSILSEAVRAARPGQWIFLYMTAGPRYEWLRYEASEKITKERLDRLAPNHPVLVFGYATNGYQEEGNALLNSKGIEECLQVHPFAPGVIDLARGTGSVSLHRTVKNDVVFRDPSDAYAKLLELELSWWAGYGVTSVGTSLMGFGPIKAFTALDQRGELPIRVGWGYREEPLEASEFALRHLANLVGYGSDYFWLIGANPGSGSFATAAPPLPGVSVRPQRPIFAPGTRGREEMEKLVKAGFRLSTIHMGGDVDVDYFLETVEKASKEAGFSTNAIQAKRHSFDHSRLIRPDQIDSIKRLGIVPSAGNDQFWEGADEFAAQYGVEHTNWMVPRQTYIRAGIRPANEYDEHFSQTAWTLFDLLEVGLTRKTIEGKTYSPGQAVSREHMLKSSTIWSAHYMLREKELGSLEVGKWADFVVLNRDYLTVPPNEIHTIEPLLTAVGGKFAHLAPVMAQEIGMQPVGAQVELGRVGGNPEAWTVDKR
ncbi:MAG: amidohydrolase family protein [Acidobacteria bacterium]|nr:amidohydrolase family protein [Acidobacteriota bacterium]